MKNYYQILEVSETASQEVIEKAYKVLAKKYHPDSQISQSSKSHFSDIAFKEISEAYNILSDKKLREQYDIELINFRKNSISSKTVNNSKAYTKSELASSYLKSFFNSLKNVIHNEKAKPKDERHRDFLALGLTILIISILIAIVFLVPGIKNLIF